VGAGETLRYQSGSNQGAEALAQVLQQRATAFSFKLPATSLAIAEQRPETQHLRITVLGVSKIKNGKPNDEDRVGCSCERRWRIHHRIMCLFFKWDVLFCSLCLNKRAFLIHTSEIDVL
jgi:hypothetical protein